MTKTIRQQLIITLIKRLPRFQYQQRGQQNRVAEITTKSGMLPTQIKTMLTAGATSRDPAVVVPMAKMYGQIFDNNPAAATGVDKGAMAFYSKVYAYDRAGVPAESSRYGLQPGLSAGRSLEADD